MKTINIPLKEYEALKNENNSLRRLVNAIEKLFNQNPVLGDSPQSPKKLEAQQLSKMNSKQMQEHFKRKIRTNN